MKSVVIIPVFLSQFAFSQKIDSIKQKAIDLQARAWKAGINKQYEQSIALADSSIALDSTRSEPYGLKSESLMSLKRYAEAAEAYRKGFVLDSNNKNGLLVSAYVFLGMLYDKADMLDRAKEQYLKAINTYENGGYKPPHTFEFVEEMEYVFAIGLVGDSEKWKEKLAGFIIKHPSSNFQKFENMSRKELLEFHFAPFRGE